MCVKSLAAAVHHVWVTAGVMRVIMMKNYTNLQVELNNKRYDGAAYVGQELK